MRILAIAAYALLLIATAAALALFGVQTRRLSALGEEAEALRREADALRAQVQQQQEVLAEQQRALEEAERQTTQQEEELHAQIRRASELEAALAEAARYALDVRACAAGDRIDPAQVDFASLSRYFTSDRIVEGDAVYARIYGRSYVENDDISLDELRYMKVLHYNFDHEICVGELIVHRDLVTDCQEIFQALFESEYEINSMYLIDNYWTGDGASSDSASIEVNNTSAFCYRKVVGGRGLSNHALGRAIDINPQQNPYVTFEDGKARWTHRNADAYIDRDTGLAHVITHDDLCYRLFHEHGFDWGGDWRTVKDYQHFDKEDN